MLSLGPCVWTLCTPFNPWFLCLLLDYAFLELFFLSFIHFENDCGVFMQLLTIPRTQTCKQTYRKQKQKESVFNSDTGGTCLFSMHSKLHHEVQMQFHFLKKTKKQRISPLSVPRDFIIWSPHATNVNVPFIVSPSTYVSPTPLLKWIWEMERLEAI